MSVERLARVDGVLVLTYTVTNRGNRIVVLNAITNAPTHDSPQVSVLDPATGVVGDRLGSPADCRCKRLPIGLGPAKAATAAVELADPGGSSLDVLFSSFQPVHGVPVAGVPAAPAAGSAAPATRRLQQRIQDLQPRTRKGASRTQGTRIDLDTDVLFDFDSARLTAGASADLRDVAKKLTEQEGRRLSVHGHTDSKGAPAYNLQLSRRRAVAVQRTLAPLLGIGWTYDVRGFGETRPVAPNATSSGSDNPQGRARNRRVELLPAP